MKRGGNESLWWESTEEEGWGVRSNSSQVFIVRNADSRSANSPTERSKIVGRTEREAQIASRNRVSIEPWSGEGLEARSEEPELPSSTRLLNYYSLGTYQCHHPNRRCTEQVKEYVYPELHRALSTRATVGVYGICMRLSSPPRCYDVGRAKIAYSAVIRASPRENPTPKVPPPTRPASWGAMQGIKFLFLSKAALHRHPHTKTAYPAVIRIKPQANRGKGWVVRSIRLRISFKSTL